MSRPTARSRGLLALIAGAGLVLLAPAGPAPRPDVAVAAAAALPTVEQLVARIDTQQKDLRSLRGEFVQHTRVKLFRQQISSEGRMLYVRGTPSKLRWEYLRPDASTLTMIGDVATLRMGTRAPQVFDTAKDPTLRAVFTQLRLWLGQGALAEAQGEYTMSTAGTPDRPALVLAPKPSSVLAKTFSRIELHVDGRTALLARLLLVEQSGDEKEIVFSKIQRNVDIAPSQFE
ncbi:MAG: outer membrane lipoprotein carrier protein LolA [Polyangia bacterium]